MTYSEKNKLVAMLIELDIKELHNELDYHMNNYNKKEARKILKVKEAVDTLIQYLEAE